MTAITRFIATNGTDRSPAEGATTGSPMEQAMNLLSVNVSTAHCGSWICSKGTLTIENYPDNEVCFITSGKLGIFDLDTNKEDLFMTGDAFVIHKGSNVAWNIYEETSKFFVNFEN